jgi:hypothetical protein
VSSSDRQYNQNHRNNNERRGGRLGDAMTKTQPNATKRYRYKDSFLFNSIKIATVTPLKIGMITNDNSGVEDVLYVYTQVSLLSK